MLKQYGVGFILGAIVALAITIMVENSQENKLHEQLTKLKSERLVFEMDNEVLKDSINALNIKIKEKVTAVDTIYLDINKIDDEKSKVINNVSSANERYLDSILTGYKHPSGD